MKIDGIQEYVSICHHSSVFLVTNPSVHLLFRLPPVCLREETVPQSHQLAPGPEQITNHI